MVDWLWTVDPKFKPRNLVSSHHSCNDPSLICFSLAGINTTTIQLRQEYGPTEATDPIESIRHVSGGWCECDQHGELHHDTIRGGWLAQECGPGGGQVPDLDAVRRNDLWDWCGGDIGVNW